MSILLDHNSGQLVPPICSAGHSVLIVNIMIDAMNSELAKKSLYNVLVQKRITWLADLRNKAAHGEWTEFDKTDVERMIPGLRNRFWNRLAKGAGCVCGPAAP
jgi:hypothetical protein